jgi:hypothetical protein
VAVVNGRSAIYVEAEFEAAADAPAATGSITDVIVPAFKSIHIIPLAVTALKTVPEKAKSSAVDVPIRKPLFAAEF